MISLAQSFQVSAGKKQKRKDFLAHLPHHGQHKDYDAAKQNKRVDDESGNGGGGREIVGREVHAALRDGTLALKRHSVAVGRTAGEQKIQTLIHVQHGSIVRPLGKILIFLHANKTANIYLVVSQRGKVCSVARAESARHVSCINIGQKALQRSGVGDAKAFALSNLHVSIDGKGDVYARKPLTLTGSSRAAEVVVCVVVKNEKRLRNYFPVQTQHFCFNSSGSTLPNLGSADWSTLFEKWIF